MIIFMSMSVYGAEIRTIKNGLVTLCSLSHRLSQLVWGRLYWVAIDKNMGQNRNVVSGRLDMNIIPK